MATWRHYYIWIKGYDWNFNSSQIGFSKKTCNKYWRWLIVNYDISSTDENMYAKCNNNHTLSRFISRMFSKWCINQIFVSVISRSRPSAQVCLESLWIHRASIPRSSASRPKPIATNRLVDFIERKKLQVLCRFKLLNWNYSLYTCIWQK